MKLRRGAVRTEDKRAVAGEAGWKFAVAAVTEFAHSSIVRATTGAVAVLLKMHVELRVGWVVCLAKMPRCNEIPDYTEPNFSAQRGCAKL